MTGLALAIVIMVAGPLLVALVSLAIEIWWRR